MMGDKDYLIDDVLYPVVCFLIDRVTGCAKSSTISREHGTYSSVMSRGASRNWRRASTREKLMPFSAKLCGFGQEVMELFSFVTTSDFFTMKF